MSELKSIELLNKAVADELATVHQYMYFHFHLDDQGFEPLATLFKRTAITEMGHIEKLAERILFLKGDVEWSPDLQSSLSPTRSKFLPRPPRWRATAPAITTSGLCECAENLDAASKKIFEELVGDEEMHFGAFDKQQEHIRQFGPAYLALQSFGKEAPAAVGA